MARDPELDHLRETVRCETVLEKAGWTYDKTESSADAKKYRGKAAGEIIIVTHGGRGWWQPLAKDSGLGEERGDVLALDQLLNDGTLGHVRRRLRPLAGIAPSLTGTEKERNSHANRDERPALTAEPALRWRATEPPRPGSAGWRYLTEERAIPPQVLAEAVRADVLREGIYGTVWGAHKDAAGAITGWEMRGPRFKGYAKGADKGAFVLGEFAPAERLVAAEAMIDAMSAAHLQGEVGKDSVRYISTGGGFGPGTEAALKGLLRPGAEVVAATDRGVGGDRLADCLARLAQEVGARFRRIHPANSQDWNDELRLTKANRAQGQAKTTSPALALRLE